MEELSGHVDLVIRHVLKQVQESEHHHHHEIFFAPEKTLSDGIQVWLDVGYNHLYRMRD